MHILLIIAVLGNLLAFDSVLSTDSSPPADTEVVGAGLLTPLIKAHSRINVAKIRTKTNAARRKAHLRHHLLRADNPFADDSSPTMEYQNSNLPGSHVEINDGNQVNQRAHHSHNMKNNKRDEDYFIWSLNNWKPYGDNSRSSQAIDNIYDYNRGLENENEYNIKMLTHPSFYNDYEVVPSSNVVKSIIPPNLSSTSKENSNPAFITVYPGIGDRNNYESGADHQRYKIIPSSFTLNHKLGYEPIKNTAIDHLNNQEFSGIMDDDNVYNQHEQKYEPIQNNDNYGPNDLVNYVIEENGFAPLGPTNINNNYGPVDKYDDNAKIETEHKVMVPFSNTMDVNINYGNIKKIDSQNIYSNSYQDTNYDSNQKVIQKYGTNAVDGRYQLTPSPLDAINLNNKYNSDYEAVKYTDEMMQSNGYQITNNNDNFGQNYIDNYENIPPPDVHQNAPSQLEMNVNYNIGHEPINDNFVDKGNSNIYQNTNDMKNNFGQSGIENNNNVDKQQIHQLVSPTNNFYPNYNTGYEQYKYIAVDQANYNNYQEVNNMINNFGQHEIENNDNVIEQGRYQAVPSVDNMNINYNTEYEPIKYNIDSTNYNNDQQTTNMDNYFGKNVVDNNANVDEQRSYQVLPFMDNMIDRYNTENEPIKNSGVATSDLNNYQYSNDIKNNFAQSGIQDNDDERNTYLYNVPSIDSIQSNFGQNGIENINVVEEEGYKVVSSPDTMNVNYNTRYEPVKYDADMINLKQLTDYQNTYNMNHNSGDIEIENYGNIPGRKEFEVKPSLDAINVNYNSGYEPIKYTGAEKMQSNDYQNIPTNHYFGQNEIKNYGNVAEQKQSLDTINYNKEYESGKPTVEEIINQDTGSDYENSEHSRIENEDDDKGIFKITNLIKLNKGYNADYDSTENNYNSEIQRAADPSDPRHHSFLHHLYKHKYNFFHPDVSEITDTTKDKFTNDKNNVPITIPYNPISFSRPVVINNINSASATLPSQTIQVAQTTGHSSASQTQHVIDEPKWNMNHNYHTNFVEEPSNIQFSDTSDHSSSSQNQNIENNFGSNKQFGFTSGNSASSQSQTVKSFRGDQQSDLVGAPYLIHVPHFRQSVLDKTNKHRSKRSLPLVRLMTDPNAKLDMPKTLENFGTVARNSFQDKRHPMYHMKNMIGSTRDVFLSALRIPPQGIIIPSQYRIIDTKKDKVVPIQDNNIIDNIIENVVPKILTEDPIVGSSKAKDKTSIKENILNRINKLRESINLPIKANGNFLGSSRPSSRLRSNFQPEETDIADTFQRMGHIFRDSIRSGQQTISHLGDVAHSAKKAFTTSTLGAPRVVRPLMRVPAVERKPLFNPNPEKVTLVTPRFLDITDDGKEKHAGDDFIDVKDVMNAFGVSNPNEDKVGLRRYVIHSKVEEKENNPIIGSRFGEHEADNNEIMKHSQRRKFFIVAEDIDDEEVASEIDILKDITNLLGVSSLKDLLTGMKSDLTYMKDKLNEKKYDEIEALTIKLKDLEQEEMVKLNRQEKVSSDEDIDAFFRSLFTEGNLRRKRQNQHHGLALPANLLKPFMGSPSKLDLNEYLREHGDSIENFNGNNENDETSSEELLQSQQELFAEALFNPNDYIGAINPVMYMKMFHQPLKVPTNHNDPYKMFMKNETILGSVPNMRDEFEFNADNSNEEEERRRISMKVHKKLLQPYMGKPNKSTYDVYVDKYVPDYGYYPHLPDKYNGPYLEKSDVSEYYSNEEY